MPTVSSGTDLPPVPGFDVGVAFSGPPGVLLHSGGPAVFRALEQPPNDPPTTPLPHGTRPAPAGANESAVPDPVASPPLSPDRSLALDALRLVRLVEGRARRPTRWSSRSFNREVDLVRAHLRPIRTRLSLAASFGREAFHGKAPAGTDQALSGSAVRVAYAIRWMELGDEIERPAWRNWLEQAAGDEQGQTRTGS